MTEPAFREIQLSTKQLVFLFMSAVVVAVVIFLLGVEVGRSVGGDAARQANTSTPGDTLVPADPPMTEPTAATSERDAAEDAAARAEAPVTAEPVPAPAEAARGNPPPPAPPPPDPDPVVAETPPPPVTANRPVAGGDWALQIGAFGSIQNADRLVATLTARGYTAYREEIASSTTPFAVRVGPFTSRAQAEVTSQRLAKEPEGYSSLIIR